MADLRFEWDPRKADANLRKHGVAFDEAQTAFFDDNALVMADPDHSAVEDRFVLLGATAAASSSSSATATVAAISSSVSSPHVVQTDGRWPPTAIGVHHET